MVVKLWRLMGCLVKKRKEEEGGEDGVVVVVVVGMEEEMEGRMVEELVAKMVVGMNGGQPKEGTVAWVCCHWLLAGRRKKKEMKEKERKGVVI